MKITGLIESYLTDKNGIKRKVGEVKNTIHSTFYEALAKHFDDNYDIALDNLFTTDYSEDYHDGINFYATDPGETEWYGNMAMITTISQPSSIQFRATGVYTNSGSVTMRAIAPILGKGWIIQSNPYGSDYGAFNDFVIASNAAFTAVDIPVSEVPTIVWTVTFTAH